MAPLSTRCLRCLTLTGDVLFMLLGVVAAVLQLVLVLPLVSLLPLPKWLLPPLLLPLLPALLALPVGFLGFIVTRSEHRCKLIGVAALQSVFALSLAVLAGWQVFLCFTPRIEADFTGLMKESLLETKWHPVYHELQCCGPVGPASFHTSIPSACCSREGGPCNTLYQQGCVAPAAERIRAVLRQGAAVQGGAALLMSGAQRVTLLMLMQFACAVSTAFLADALKNVEKQKRERDQLAAPEAKPLRSTLLNQRY